VHIVEAYLSSWKPVWLSALLLGMLSAAPGQPKPETSGPDGPSIEPKIQLSFVSSCRPTPAEVEQMRRVLKLVEGRPRFSTDFEISRGVTTLTAAEARAAGLEGKSTPRPSPWVRIRREFPANAVLSDAQYSLSVEDGSASEVLALRLRNTEEALQILISTSAVGSAGDMVRSDTPPARIQVERFGEAALVLARCPQYDQSAYTPVFRAGDKIMRSFRAAMAVKTVIPAEMARLPGGRQGQSNQSAPKRGAPNTAGGK